MDGLRFKDFEKKTWGNGHDYYFEKVDDAGPFEQVAEKTIDTPYGKERVFLKKSKALPLYDYGLEQLYSDDEHGYGYIWSSRCGVINKYFGTSLVEVVVGWAIYAMDVKDLIQYLPKGHKFVKDAEDCLDGDVVYVLKEGD